MLNKIEAELPALGLSPDQRREAEELVEGLKPKTGPLNGALTRAAGAALGSILAGAGSKLGTELATAIGIALSGLV